MKGGGLKTAETSRSKEQLSLRGIWELSGTRMRQLFWYSEVCSPVSVSLHSSAASLSRLLSSARSSLCSVGKINAPAWNHLLVPVLDYTPGLFAQVFEKDGIHLVTDQLTYWLSLFIPH